MKGLGTIVNVLLVVVGGSIGTIFGGRIPVRFRQTMNAAVALAVMFIGIGGTLQHMLVFSDGELQTTGTMMMVISMVVGSVIGELLNLERFIERFGSWLKRKTGSAKDPQFVDAFVSASITLCVGAMAVIGSIQDGIYGDHSILFAKAVMDMITVMVMAATMGRGCTFSAIPIALVQGAMTLLAAVLSPMISYSVLNNLSYVGSILIFCIGINLMFDRHIRVANLLPALAVAVLWR